MSFDMGREAKFSSAKILFLDLSQRLCNGVRHVGHVVVMCLSTNRLRDIIILLVDRFNSILAKLCVVRDKTRMARVKICKVYST